MSESMNSVWRRLFEDHLAAVREGYIEHFLAAGRFGSRLLIIAGACLCHAIIPGVFEDTASKGVKTLADELTRRRCCDPEGGAGI